jgi:hypothetical protein
MLSLIKMKKILCILILLIIFSCKQKVDENNKIIFTTPLIVQPKTNDTIEYIETKYISHVFPEFIGKYKIGENKIELPIHRIRDTSISLDFIDEPKPNHIDTFSNDGFELYTDYKSTISRNKYDFRFGNFYFPVYAVNGTNNEKIFNGKDGYVFAIQEALDSLKDWRPIEGRGFDFCGNGKWGLKVSPNEFVVFLMPKYKGNYYTKLRIRLKIGNNTYVSKPFDGKINYTQFYLDKKEDFHYRQLIEDKSNAILYYFYGAIPKETEDENFGKSNGLKLNK